MAESSGEFALIDWIRRNSARQPQVETGIGDDASVLRFDSGRTIVTADMLMDGVHFRLSESTPESVGRKCLAVNLSDVAAMAGQPTAAFLCLALPRTGGAPLAERLYDGMKPLAEQFNVEIAGGDTNIWDGPLVVSVTILGEPAGVEPILRSGAHPGDWLLVTGSLGGSLSGRHLTFTPRVQEAMALARSASLHAMIDLSDGLASDLRHILRESQVGALIDANTIPISDDVDPALSPAEQLHHALTDGEDFELLLTLSPEQGAALLQNPPVEARLTKIGTISAEQRCLMVDFDGETVELPSGGWEHRFGSTEPDDSPPSRGDTE